MNHSSHDDDDPSLLFSLIISEIFLIKKTRMILPHFMTFLFHFDFVYHITTVSNFKSYQEIKKREK